MSTSWRADIIFDNRSGKSIPSSGNGIGATVVRAKRGTLEPMYFSKGETQKMVNLLGLPDASNPELLEALEYCNHYPIWVSAPSVNGHFGGVLLSDSGTEELDAPVRAVPASMAEVQVEIPLGVGDGATTSFGATLDRFAEYIGESVDLYIDGTAQEITAADTAGTEDLTGTNISSGSLIVATGVTAIDFTAAPAEGEVLTLVYNLDLSSYFLMLLAKSPSDDYLKVQITEDSDVLTLEALQKTATGSFVVAPETDIEFSMTPGTVNGFGVNIYVDSAFENSEYFIPVTEGGAAYSSFTSDSSAILLSGGDRGDTVSGTDLAAGYDAFQAVRKYQIDVFFDATADQSIPAKFATLRASYHKYSKFLLPTPNQAIADTLTWTIPAIDRGISYYYGWFKMRNLFNNTGNVISIPMGEVAKNTADIVVKAFGGLAPAWVNENGGLGGQLTSGRAIESVYEPDEAQLKQLDEARINAITLDPSFGLMIMSRRTSVVALSDYSFIDYSGLIDYAVKNIVEQVLPYQYVKLNDDIHRAIVYSKCETILEPMTVAPRNVIQDYAIKCDGENNDDVALAAEKFILDVAIKVTPKSRTVQFRFINTPQGADVKELVA